MDKGNYAPHQDPNELVSWVRTDDIKRAVSGRELSVLNALGIRWPQDRKTHIDCPYPEHGGTSDWRWDDKKRKAFCTCSKGGGIFDVVAKCDGLDFEAAKIRVAEIIGCHDLIKTKSAKQAKDKRYQKQDAVSLLN